MASQPMVENLFGESPARKPPQARAAKQPPQPYQRLRDGLLRGEEPETKAPHDSGHFRVQGLASQHSHLVPASYARGTIVGRHTHEIQKARTTLIGVGIGVGIGVLIAPASGEETRDDIANKVSEFSDKVRERAGNPPDATGTHGVE